MRARQPISDSARRFAIRVDCPGTQAPFITPAQLKAAFQRRPLSRPPKRSPAPSVARKSGAIASAASCPRRGSERRCETSGIATRRCRAPGLSRPSPWCWLHGAACVSGCDWRRRALCPGRLYPQWASRPSPGCRLWQLLQGLWQGGRQPARGADLRNLACSPAALRHPFPSTTGCFRRKPLPPSHRGRAHKSWSRPTAS
jgi:hypothetical protein